MLHAAMYVFTEIAITHTGIDMFVLCACIGLIEACLLVVWNVFLLSTHGVSLYLPAERAIDARSVTHIRTCIHRSTRHLALPALRTYACTHACMHMYMCITQAT